MRGVSFLEIAENYKQQNEFFDIEFNNANLDVCKQISKQIQNSLLKNQDQYSQLHLNTTPSSSLAMSALTNSVF